MKVRAVVATGFAICAVVICFSKSGSAQERAQEKTPEKTLQGDLVRGKAIFEMTCDECHDAYSREARTGPGLQGLKNGKLANGRPATHDKLIDVVNNGPAEMPKFQDRLTEQQKEDVVAFLMTL